MAVGSEAASAVAVGSMAAAGVAAAGVAVGSEALAHGGVTVAADTIGAAWLEIARHIMATGAAEHYDGLPILEIENATLVVAHPEADDPLIARFGDAERLAWMRANFVDHEPVEALGGARSYASRFFDYAKTGRDQISWVIERLRADPTSRSATITTFEPLLDTTYIPCVSMLDFWLRRGAVDLVVYAHSIDFGAKGYGNLTELAILQAQVADALHLPRGTLRFIVKSAHVYDTDLATMQQILTA